MQALLQREDLVPETMPWEEVLDRIMYQCGKEDLCNLPETGLDRTVEHQLSSIFIQPIDFKVRQDRQHWYRREAIGRGG